jgi:hypothetical protein
MAKEELYWLTCWLALKSRKPELVKDMTNIELEFAGMEQITEIPAAVKKAAKRKKKKDEPLKIL